MTSCSVFKSLTIDTTAAKSPNDLLIEMLQQKPVPHRVRSIFYEGGLVPAKVRSPKEDVAAFYWENVSCNDDDGMRIWKETLGQNINDNWIQERKPRISASTTRLIGFARTKETLLNHFFRGFFDNDYMRYGRETEPEAIQKYSTKYGKVVHESGLVISRYLPWLCASPDGLIVNGNQEELVVLEIKCPVSGNSGTIDFESLDFIKEGKVKKAHKYFAQIQIQLFCCDAKMGHFFIYGKENDMMIELPRDDKFC